MQPPRSLRILLSEGSSLSARQTITALGRCGYILDVCDPNALCISRFSRFVRHYYRCPAVGTDPPGYLALVQMGLLDGTREIVVQEEVPGALCQAQAVFAHGHLLAVHCTQTRGVSVGGGHAARMGVDHPQVREHLVALGQSLEWHGPLAL